MVKNVVKRDGRVVGFNEDKIVNAVLKAFKDVDSDITEDSKDIAVKIANEISSSKSDELSVEEIQDMVEELLASSDRKDISKAYI